MYDKPHDKPHNETHEEHHDEPNSEALDEPLDDPYGDPYDDPRDDPKQKQGAFQHGGAARFFLYEKTHFWPRLILKTPYTKNTTLLY